MKLSVLTVTCRKDPRFAEMARSLFWSFRRAPADTLLEWIVVDELLWTEDQEARAMPMLEALHALPAEAQARIHIEHFAPPPSELRGPDIADPLPAHNTAANAGLLAIDIDSAYVVYLSDCSCVTADWVQVALDCALKGFGWKCRMNALHDAIIPTNGPLRHQDAWDNFHPVPATTVAGPCWGAPRDSLITVGGFDPDYDGEDDLYQHEILLRLGRAGVQFVTTKRAGVLRLNRTRHKSDVTTRKETLRAKRNQIYFQHLGQDKDRTLPGARAAQTTTTSLAGRAPKALRMPDVPPPAPPPRATVAPRANAFRPPPRPSASSKSEQAPLEEQQPVTAAPAPASPALELAHHANEICGVLNSGRPCIRQMLHMGAHIFGTPRWVQGIDPATFVELYQLEVKARAEFAEIPAPAGGEEHAAEVIAQADQRLDDLWYVMSDQQRDEVDPEGAAERAAQRQNLERAVEESAADRPMTLHEKAKAAREARKQRAELERAGVAPPPQGDERCPHVPTQGRFQGLRCILRKPHGGAHKYPEPGTEEAATDAPPAQLPVPKAPVKAKAQPNPGAPAKRASREPPSPTAEVAETMAKIDEATLTIQQALAREPNDAAKLAVMLGVVVRREGLLCKEVEYLSILHDAVPHDEKDTSQSRQIKIDQALARVQRLCAKLPAIPCTPTQFKALEKHAIDLDQWRPTQGLPARGAGIPLGEQAMPFIDRCFGAAADAGIDIQQPDDFGDYGTDDLTSLERANARAVDEVESVEPLSEDEAKEQAMAPIREIAKRYADELALAMGITEADVIARIDQGNGTPPIVWMREEDAVNVPTGVIVGEDDQTAALTCWPAHVDPSFGPTEERNVAVAMLLG